MGIAPIQVQRRQRGGQRLFAMHAVAPHRRQAGGPGFQRRASAVAQARLQAGALELVVLRRAHAPRQFQGMAVIGVAPAIGQRARQDQRHLGIVDQTAVGFVDQCHAQAAQQRSVVGAFLAQTGGALQERAARVAARQAVAQVVERQLAGSAVGDVAGVLGPPCVRIVRGFDCADREAESAVQGAQGGGIAPHQILIGGDHMHRQPG